MCGEDSKVPVTIPFLPATARGQGLALLTGLPLEVLTMLSAFGLRFCGGGCCDRGGGG